MQENKTAGQISQELQSKESGKISVVEQQQAMTGDYMKNLFEAVDRGFKDFPGDFFIHVETKREVILDNVIRNYFIARSTCPTPNYDQTVFRYNRLSGEIEYWWTIPSRDACHHIKNNKHLIVKEEQQLLSFVLAFDEGKLLQLCKKLNGEKEDSIQLEEN